MRRTPGPCGAPGVVQNPGQEQRGTFQRERLCPPRQPDSGLVLVSVFKATDLQHACKRYQALQSAEVDPLWTVLEPQIQELSNCSTNRRLKYGEV